MTITTNLTGRVYQHLLLLFPSGVGSNGQGANSFVKPPSEFRLLSFISTRILAHITLQLYPRPHTNLAGIGSQFSWPHQGTSGRFMPTYILSSSSENENTPPKNLLLPKPLETSSLHRSQFQATNTCMSRLGTLSCSWLPLKTP